MPVIRGRRDNRIVDKQALEHAQLTSARMVNDRRDEMSLAELVEELELAYPERVAGFERRYPAAMAAVIDDDLEACDPDELDDLRQDLRNPLGV